MASQLVPVGSLLGLPTVLVRRRNRWLTPPVVWAASAYRRTVLQPPHRSSRTVAPVLPHHSLAWAQILGDACLARTTRWTRQGLECGLLDPEF